MIAAVSGRGLIDLATDCILYSFSMSISGNVARRIGYYFFFFFFRTLALFYNYPWIMRCSQFFSSLVVWESMVELNRYACTFAFHIFFCDISYFCSYNQAFLNSVHPDYQLWLIYTTL